MTKFSTVTKSALMATAVPPLISTISVSPGEVLSISAVELPARRTGIPPPVSFPRRMIKGVVMFRFTQYSPL
ncbi:MAG: hypothetical protein A4E51_00277 [Methanosaeta sp. PtaU1.Bin055]|nr:MAG: hypothetical protein A4E51_00277 [Methanosaeta sp. PtaU1.Bin055]